MPPKRKKNIKHKIQGDGLNDIYQGVKSRLDNIINFKPRGNEPTKRFDEFLNSTSNKQIKSVAVGRKPIVSNIKKALDFLSGGKFSKKAKDLSYDDVYHQFLIVEYEDGTRDKIERNHVVENHPVKDEDLKNVLFDIPVTKELTTKRMIENAMKNDKEKDFFVYNPETSNCVEFVREMIDGSNLMPDVDTNKVLGRQDSKQLLDTIPNPLKKIPLVITTIASNLDSVIHGGGLSNTLRNDNLLTARLILEGKL